VTPSALGPGALATKLDGSEHPNLTFAKTVLFRELAELVWNIVGGLGE
jgi:hypothetical protein